MEELIKTISEILANTGIFIYQNGVAIANTLIAITTIAVGIKIIHTIIWSRS